MLTVLSIIAITAYRIGYLYSAELDLFFDEAQYWLWAQDLDFGYYSKPPIVAWTIAFTTSLLGDSEAAVRLGSPIYHAITAGFMFKIGSYLYSQRVGFWSTLTYLTLPAVSLSSSLISTDPALLCFWTIALWCFLQARDTNSLIWWCLAGVAGGVGMLSKYNMVLFVPSALLALALSPQHRSLLTCKGLWIAMVIAASLFIPNVIWNAQYGFVSFLHTKDNAHLTGPLFHIDEMLAFVGAQFGVFGPLLGIAFIMYLIKGKTVTDSHTLLSFFWPLFLVIITVSFLSRAHANWAAPIYITATLLVVAWLVESQRTIWLQASVILHMVAALLFMHFHGVMHMAGIELSGTHTDLSSHPITIKDPYKRIKGWKALSDAVHEVAMHYPDAIILSDERKIAAPLHYYLNRDKAESTKRIIVKWNSDDRIEDHYELIDHLDNYPSRPALYVTRINHPDLYQQIALHYGTMTTLAPITLPLYDDYQPVYALYYFTPKE